jgi:hypothetical protein
MWFNSTEKLLTCLPAHGQINCPLCHHQNPVVFNRTVTKDEEGNWRITANPLAWGNPNAEIIVLGFSKGPTQARAIATSPHNDIAAKGSGRTNIGKILPTSD